MEVVQEDQANYIQKGKRTKRQKPVSPFALTMSTTSYTSEDGSHGGGDSGLTTSPSSNSDEEDMANCLILLAKGRPESIKVVGAEVYQCKTCDRCFPSFQALGGHRASHKKPKVIITSEDDQKKPVQEKVQFKYESTTLSLQIPSKSRVHECSICGAEFNSGQALGGHMRRHRPMTPVAVAAATSNSSHEDYIQAVKKQRTLLSLDLNLPAPAEDDHHREQAAAKFAFASKEQVIVFSASPLVDCHY